MTDRDQQDDLPCEGCPDPGMPCLGCPAVDQRDEQPAVICCGGDSKACMTHGPCLIERKRRDQQDEQVTASCDRCEWAGSLNDVVAHILTHSHGYVEGERAATERIERLIEASEPRSYQSRDCGTVHTDTAFEDWRDELLAAIREGRA